MRTTGNTRVGKTLGAIAALATMLAGPAVAADLPTYVYEEPVYDKAGAWYLRGDIGYVATRDYSATYNGSAGHQEFYNEDYDHSWLIGVGVGYQFNHYFRMDLTWDYTATWDFEGNTICLGGGGCGSTYNDEYSSFSMHTVLANAYLDWENSSSWTPYIGAGLGFAYINAGRHYANNADGSYAAFGENGNFNFAAAAMAGVSYEVSQNFSLDASYRYLWVGDVESGESETSGLTGKVTYHDVDFHQVRVGGRYTFH
ncbi:MAG: outer membrane beta-barrel protein [Hyphomicrobiales bacterium]